MSDADLKQELATSWHRFDGMEIPDYSVDPDQLDEVGIDELRAAVDAGLSISIVGGSGTGSTTSLAFLEPIIPVVRDLRLWTSNQVTELDVLAGAHNLRTLHYVVGRCSEVLDLSGLRQLEAFDGDITRSVASVLRNPSLRLLRVWGAIPKSYAHVVGPIEVYEQEGGRSQVTLPEFAHPGAMTRLSRRGAAQFDLSEVSAMMNLVKLEITNCKDLSGLSVLADLSKLANLQLKGVGTRERWDLVPDVPSAFMLDLSPHPSASLLASWRAAGWLVPDDPQPSQTEEIFVDEAGDGESWGVFMSRFEGLAAAVEALEGIAAGGRHGELLILGAVTELRAGGATLNPEPDSEGDYAAVYFPTRDQAEQVATLARTMLHSDTATQLRYLDSNSY